MCSAPARRARALPRSSYRALSSTSRFSEDSTVSGRDRPRRNVPWAIVARQAERTSTWRYEPTNCEGPSGIRRDPPLAPKISPQDAGPPPVFQRKSKSVAQFGLGPMEVREPRRLLREGRAGEFPVAPHPERHPVLVDFHEDDRAGLAPPSCEMLEDREAGRVVGAGDLLRIGRPAARELMVVGRGRTRLEIPRLESLEHEGPGEQEDHDVVRQAARPRDLELGGPRIPSHLVHEGLRQDVVHGRDGPFRWNESATLLG